MKKYISLLLVLLLSASPVLAETDVIVNKSRVIRFGFMVDKTDGVTLEASLTPGTFVVHQFTKNRPFVAITPAACTLATSTLTSTGTNPADGDTVTIAGSLNDGTTTITEVYRFKNTLAQAFDVKIGGTAAITLDNLKCAMLDTGCGGEGTDWGTGTTASQLVSATTNTDTTQVVAAHIPGTLPNAFTTAETSAQLSWTGSTLASGNDDCIVYEAAGHYSYAIPASRLAYIGDTEFTFTYAAEAAPTKVFLRVIADSSYGVNLRGENSTAQGVWDIAKTAADDTAGSIGEHLAGVAQNQATNIYSALIADHTVADSFGARLARTATDSRPLVVDANGLADANTVKVGPTGSGTAQTAGDIIGDTNDIQSRLPAALGANGNLKADVRDYNGTAGTFASGRPEVNVSHAAGTAWNSGAIGPNTLAADTITASKVASDVSTEIWGNTFSELSQATPSATPSAANAIMLLYMSLRNRLEVTSSEKRITNDAGTVIVKKTLSDNGTTYVETEAVAGP